PPGRVDSPPTSMMSAPSEISRSAWATASSTEANRPPSLKLSGVTFKMPMMSVRSPMGISKFLTFQSKIRGLGRSGIPACNRRQQRLLNGLGSRLLELWTIRVATIGNRRVLVERQARDNSANLHAVERLTLQQAFSQPDHRVAILLDDRLCALKLRGDDLLHLLVDLDRGVFREVTMLGNLASEEDLLFLLAEREWSHL